MLMLAGLNPLTASSLPGGTDTTPRNVTWNVQWEQELRKNLNLAGRLSGQPYVLFFAVNPFTAPVGEESFLALTNTGSSRYRELETTVRFTIRGKS